MPFIELGVGFNPELTGRENVYLNGALLGFTPEEITAMYDDIVEFAELQEFMDQKLKNYSSGMQVRLAFSVAIKAQGDILVLDEVLAVGDEAFQRKCDDFFAQIKKDRTKTVILVTHSMDAVRRYCNRAIMIEHGDIVAKGDKSDVADKYTLENLQDHSHDHEENPQDTAEQKEAPAFERVPVFRVKPVDSLMATSFDPFVFDVEYQFEEDVPFYISLTVHDMQRGGIAFDSEYETGLAKPGRHTLRMSFPLTLLSNGNYRMQAHLCTFDDPDDIHSGREIAFTDGSTSCDFAVRIPDNEGYGVINRTSIRVDHYDLHE